MARGGSRRGGSAAGAAGAARGARKGWAAKRAKSILREGSGCSSACSSDAPSAEVPGGGGGGPRAMSMVSSRRATLGARAKVTGQWQDRRASGGEM